MLASMPRLYLGTMTFAWKQASSYVNDATALAFVTRFAAMGGRHVDTARIYAGGETEPMLGRALAQLNDEGIRDELLIGSTTLCSNNQISIHFRTITKHHNTTEK